MKSARFGETLRVLAQHQVEFIVVGMAARILQGVPVATLDVDIVHHRARVSGQSTARRPPRICWDSVAS
ncbi:MAG TPA: hypothetical protein VHW01_20870 [Polyangiaceae bacterium]|jgi:hypothetical protein|nr:hypothetical protein [Polyangiaceae bacterium]